MRPGSIFAMIALLTASAACAGGIPKVYDGDMALVFEFNGLGAMGMDTYAGGVGFRYFYYDEFAFRGSFNLAYWSWDDEGAGRDTSRAYIGGTFIIERYMDPIGSLAPYLGGGIGHFWNREWHPTLDPGEPKRDISTTDHIVEMPLVGGFQWFFADALSLGGEYRLAFRYIKSDTHREGAYDRHFQYGSTRTAFGFTAVSVFLSLHWPG